MKKILSFIIIFAICIYCMPMETHAKTADNVTIGGYVYDPELGRDVFINIEDTSTYNLCADGIYNYEVYEDNNLKYSIEVNLTDDQATLYYVNGDVEHLILSDHISVEKIADVTTRAIDIDDTLTSYALTATDYIGAEPLEITSTGAQKSLGTTVYSGYEAMGSRSYANPTESGYLQRKNSGYITFDSYKFEISAGTKLSVAAAAIAAYLTGAGVAIVVGIITNLLCSLLQVTVDAVIDHNVNGNFRCREYRWDYRVRRNSNTGTILLSEYKCRYWWEMYDNSGNRSFESKPGTGDGWALSNSDMIAYALGRM